MLDVEELEFERRSDCLYVHFDVPGNFLSLNTFVQTAEQAQRIVEAFDQTFFEGKLEYELIILAPEPGTFLKKLAIYVSGGIAALYAFLNTDVGKAYVEGLTGHEPAHWARQIGESHGEKYEDASDWLERSLDPNETSDEDACKVSARIVVEMTKGVLERETSELEHVGMGIGQLPEALDARSEFFHVCISDPHINGIGFTPEDDFPIPRASFIERAVFLPRTEDEDEASEWVVKVENIFVTSPNWDKNDQSARKWKGKDINARDCYFTIEDEEFWLHVNRKDLIVDVLDRLKVQWAIELVDERVRNRRVLRVLEFNGEKLADPLSHEAILAIVGQVSEQVRDPDQRLLF